jgi:hypothetical protein
VLMVPGRPACQRATQRKATRPLQTIDSKLIGTNNADQRG